MKGKSIFSALAVIVLIAATIMFITRFDFDDMDGDKWTLVLIVTGVLLGVIALIFKKSSRIDDDDDDDDDDEDDDEDEEESQLNLTELKLLELRKCGLLTEDEYRKKLADARAKSVDYQKAIENLKTLIAAGLLTKDEFEQKAKEAYEMSKNNSQTDDSEPSIDPSSKIAKLMSLRESGLISQKEFEEHMANI